jgi:hypothetical protein
MRSTHARHNAKQASGNKTLHTTVSSTLALCNAESRLQVHLATTNVIGVGDQE